MGLPHILSQGRKALRSNLMAFVFSIVSVGLLVDLLTKLFTGMLLLKTLAIYLRDGIILGLIIGLAGIGLSMVYDILNFPNFAHGEYLTVGGFAGWVTSFLIAGIGRFDFADLLILGIGSSAISSQSVGISATATPGAVFLGAVIAAAITIILAIVLDRLVYRPMRDSSGISLLIASIGVAFILRYTLAIVFGTGTIGLTSGTNVPSYSVPLVSLSIGAHQVALLVASLGLMVGLHFFLQRTKLGIAMRAMSDNRALAQVTGIPVERVVRLTWILGAGLTGVAGYLLTLEQGTISFDFGWSLLLLIFSGVILGGIGSIYGAVLGGLAIGVVSRLSLVWLPGGFVKVTAFGVMILVLLVRPQGLFSGGSTT